MTRNYKACAVSLLLLTAACQQGSGDAAQSAPLTKAQKDEVAITKLCNEVAAELVANPGSQAPLIKLRKRHMEEEWSFADVDRICSVSIARKTKLMYGSSPSDAPSSNDEANQVTDDLERLADKLGNE
jgi:hypothetical protein